MRTRPLAVWSLSLVLLGLSGRAVPVFSAEAQAALLNGTPLPFYVYHGYKSPDNHYTPSGWMGDYSDIRMDERWSADKNARQVIRISYTAKASRNNGWAGIYWQNPANNWGNHPGGYNLNGTKQMSFLARGEKGGEVISEFKVGGISGNFADSGAAAVGPLTLTSEWKEYHIPLEGQELSSISGGFCWTMTKTDNPNGATFYLDNIRFE